jgi:3-deoxy-D-manno-octulosonic-acid transferase
MISLYRFLLRLLAPFLVLYFYVRCLYGKDRLESVKNHFGVANIRRPAGKLIWIHAASIGESTAALTFINHIKKRFPNLNVLITTITVTSADMLSSKIAKIPNCYHQFMVMDNDFWVKKFLNCWKPDVSVFLESEIWPNTVDILKKRNIPIFLLNARLSARSFQRWKIAKWFIAEILKKFDCIMAQSEGDKQRYSTFSPHNVVKIDNLKYANDPLVCNERLFKIFSKIFKGKKVLVAASTHEKEEEIIIEAHEKLKKKFEIVTVIIPRHITRVKRITDIIKEHSYTFLLRSQIDQNMPEGDPNFANTCADMCSTDIYVVDVFGEVGTFFRLADVTFVGGSIVPIGGHNIYEPVALGKPVLHGNFMNNALEVRDFLKSYNVAFEVKNSKEIYDVCHKLLSNEKLLRNIAETALSITKNESLKKIDDLMQLDRFFA